MSMVHSGQEAVIPTELVARLEAVSVGNREIDAEIFRAFGCPLPTEFAGHGISLTWQPDGKATLLFGDLQVAYTPPAYTTSLDAAMTLVGQVQPGRRVFIDACGDGQATANVFDVCNPNTPWATASSPALALCLAILKATTANSVGTEAEGRSAPTTPPVKTGEG